MSEIPHPSVFIREEREARGWSRLDLAMRMGGTNNEEVRLDLYSIDMYDHVGPTMLTMPLGEFMAGQLSQAFGVSAAFFLALHAAWLAEVESRGIETRQGGDGTAPSRSDDSPSATRRAGNYPINTTDHTQGE